MRPAPADLSEIPYILEQLNIMDTRNNNGELDVSLGGEQFDEDDDPHYRRSLEDRALAPRISSLENR